MIYLWVDPWTQNIWLCLADERQVIAFLTVEWKKSLYKDDRLAKMMTVLRVFLTEAKWIVFDKIDYAFIEYPVIFRNAKTSMILAESLWRIKSELYKQEILTKEVYVQEVKKMVWAMKKEDIIAKTMIECETHNRPKPKTEHEADAYRIMRVGQKKLLESNEEKNAKEKKGNHKKSRD